MCLNDHYFVVTINDGYIVMTKIPWYRYRRDRDIAVEVGVKGKDNLVMAEAYFRSLDEKQKATLLSYLRRNKFIS